MAATCRPSSGISRPKGPHDANKTSFTPDEWKRIAPGFKTWLHHIAEGAAEAASEGGFLGFGGVTVSDAERATLGELSSALGLGA